MRERRLLGAAGGPGAAHTGSERVGSWLPCPWPPKPSSEHEA